MLTKFARSYKWLLAIVIPALIYSGATTQVTKTNAEQNVASDSDSTTQLEDSVEVIGTPTGENPWKEMANLIKEYYNRKGIRYSGTIKVIDDNQPIEKVIEEQPFEYSIINGLYYYRLGPMELVCKKNFLLSVDNDNKTISFSKNVIFHTGGHKVFDVRTLKKLLQKGGAHAQVTQNGDEKILTIDHIADPNIQGYRIYYSPQTYKVHKILIGMLRLNSLDDEAGVDGNQQSTSVQNSVDSTDNLITTYSYYLEVLFSQIQHLSLQENEFNPENKFITAVNDTGVLFTPAYKDYQILNTIEP